MKVALPNRLVTVILLLLWAFPSTALAQITVVKKNSIQKRRPVAPMRDGKPLAAWGTVLDGEDFSKIPHATVLLVRASDSTISCYGITDFNGDFAVYTTETGEHYLQISTIGYVTSSTLVKAPMGQLSIVELYPDPKEIEAVRVEARRRGMRVHGDTVEYNVQAFLTGAERTLGDLLAQLPDIKITPEGGAIAQGKKVDRILFNGRDLFAGNVQLATKNVGAGVVDSVSVLHGYSEFDLLMGYQSRPETVINIGVKPGMLGKISGEIEGGYGYRQAASGRLNAIYMGSENMVAAIGGVNLNTGDPSFTTTDLLSFVGGLVNFQPPPDAVWEAAVRQKNVSRLLTGVGSVYYNYHKPNKLKARFGAMYTYSAKDASEQLTLITLAGRQRGDTLALRARNGGQTQGIYLHGGVAWTPTPRWLVDWSMGLSGFASATEQDHHDFYNSVPIFTNETNNERPLGLQQSLNLSYKTGIGLLEVGANYILNDNRPRAAYMGDTILLPLTLAPLASGAYTLDHTITEQTHRVNAHAGMKFDLRKGQYIEVRAENRSDIMNYESRFASEGKSVAAAPWVGLPMGNDSKISLSDFKLGVAWVKNEGPLQAEISLSGHLLYYAFNQAPSAEQGHRWYAEPVARLEYKVNALNSLTLEGGIGQSYMLPFYFLYGMEPISYRSVRYNTAYRNFFNSTPYARLRYRFATKGADFVYSLSGKYNYLSSTLDDNLRIGLTELTTPAGRGTGHSGRASMDIDWTIRSFWSLYAGVEGGYERRALREFGETLRSESWSASTYARLRTTYVFPLNGSIRAGWGREFSRFLGDEWWNMMSWNVEGSLTLKHKKLFATVSALYNEWPFLPAREVVELNAEISYEIWNGISLILLGRNLLGLKESQKLNSTFTEVYRQDVAFGILPGFIMAKLRWEFNRGEGSKRKPVIMMF